jgi:glutathione S-transferase
MQPILYVGNRNYSSWSLRPWLVLEWGKLEFETRVIELGGPGYGERQMAAVLAISPSGTLPVLHVGEQDVIGDSLAIAEWAAEQVPELWPRDARKRALARSVTCEMHSGFSALRGELLCNIRRRAEPRALSARVRRDVARVEAIWSTLCASSGGPYLFGASPTIADAFFTPVATRFRTYGVTLAAAAQRYCEVLLANSEFRAWEALAEQEPFKMATTDSH